jgi:hypothetical protein
MENTLNSEINTKSVYISVNNNTNKKIPKIRSINTIWNKLSQKNHLTHATVPLKGYTRVLNIKKTGYSI